MKEYVINKVNEKVYEYTLDNNLKVFIVRKPNFNKKVVFYETKYGSVNNCFAQIGETKLKKYPFGIAHFLEHKLFESKDGIDYFKLFQKNGAYINAATSYDKTYYFFSCSDNFLINLENLLNLVENPYFTDQNVEKEKGIIGQEIDMYKNRASEVLYKTLYYNCFNKDYRKYDIAGEKEDIKKITKEDLYECYNTFYNPSNMFLTIVGDIDVSKTIDLIKKHENKRKIIKNDKIIEEEIKEKYEVCKKEEVIYHNVENEKVGYLYKLFRDKQDDVSMRKANLIIRIFINSRFGRLSLFEDYLIKNNLVKSYFDYSIDISEKYILLGFDYDPIDDLKVKKLIDEKLNNMNNLKEEFELYKKTRLVNFINAFEKVDEVATVIRQSYECFGKIVLDDYDVIKGLTYDEYISYIKKLDFNNYTKVIVKPNKSINEKEENMKDKKCNCKDTCTCGCKEGKKCTCKDKNCKCEKSNDKKNS